MASQLGTAANKPLCLSSTPLQAWPEKARRVGVVIGNANINLNSKQRVDY